MLTRTRWLLVLVGITIGVTLLSGLTVGMAAVLVAVAAFLVFVPLRSLSPETRRLAWATGTRRWVWFLGAVVFTAGVGGMHLIGDPVYHVECSLRTYRRCRTGHNWATVVYFFGVAGGVIAASLYPQYRLITTGHQTSPDVVEPGSVVVSGEVVPYEDPLTAPFSEEDAVCYRYAVQERHNSRLFTDDGSWHTVDVGEQSVPFFVANDSGHVLVDPADAALTLNEVTAFGPVGDIFRTAAESDAPTPSSDPETGLSDTAQSGGDGAGSDPDDAVLDAMVNSGRVYQADTEYLVTRDQEPPSRMAAWEQDNTGMFPVISHDRKYTEDLLQPGDTVTVAGRADTFPHGYPERIVIGGDGTPTKISAGSQHHVSSHFTGAVWIGGAIATVCIPLGLALMLWTLS